MRQRGSIVMYALLALAVLGALYMVYETVASDNYAR